MNTRKHAHHSNCQNPVAATHWAQIGESTFVWGIWLLFQIHRWVGRWFFLLCLYPVVLYYWLSQPQARRASMLYLQRLQQAHQIWKTAPRWRHSIRHFLRFAQVLLDKMLAISGNYPLSRVGYSGQALILDLIAQKRGAIFVTAHIGCIELCQVLAQNRGGLRLNILVHTRHAEKFNRLLKQLAPESQVHFIQVDQFNAATAMMLADRVAQGEFIAIAGDRVPVHKSQTVTAPFLGHEAQFPSGPYVLAALLKCPLFFMSCTQAPAGYALRITELASTVVLPRGQREKALGEYVRLFAHELEQRLVQAPYDWFNFFSFWAQGNGVSPQPDNAPTQPL